MTIINAEDFSKEQSKNEGKDFDKSEIEQILSNIELKRAQMRQVRDENFISLW